MPEIKFVNDITTPKYMKIIAFDNLKFVNTKILKDMPHFLSSILGIPRYVIREKVFEWDVTGNETIKFSCVWNCVDSEIDPYTKIVIMVGARGEVNKNDKSGSISFAIKGKLETVFEYSTVIEKVLKIHYFKYLYKKRLERIREIGKIYMERIENELKKTFGGA